MINPLLKKASDSENENCIQYEIIYALFEWQISGLRIILELLKIKSHQRKIERDSIDLENKNNQTCLDQWF